MQRIFHSQTVTTGLAIFSMLFGAGNLIYPLKVGSMSGQYTIIGLVAFLITAVLLPVIGLIAMILFDGNYEAFFERMGKRVGSICIFGCMIILGPGLVIPRIVTLSHKMILPFLPAILGETTGLSALLFAFLFLAITFLCTYKENKIVDLLGYIISPLLLIALGIIIIKGFFLASTPLTTTIDISSIIKINFLRGYETLDLLGTIFFSSIILVILKQTLGAAHISKKARIIIGLKAGLLGVTLLGIIYCGMAYLGTYFGQGLDQVDAGELFRLISCRILGEHGSIIIAIAVLMACLSTAIGLSGVVTHYLQNKIFRNTIGHASTLVLTLIACMPLSICGLDYILKLTAGPLTYIGYPVLITLTLCNIAYKVTNFTAVKLPVGIVFIYTLFHYWWY